MTLLHADGAQTSRTFARHGRRRVKPSSRFAHFEARLQKTFDPIAATERVRHADIAREDRTNRKNDERNRHRWRRVMRRVAMRMPVSMGMGVVSRRLSMGGPG